MPIHERLHLVFVAALELPPETDVRQIKQRVDPCWDSLNHMALVIAIEDEFGVELDVDDVLALEDFAAAEKILRTLGISD